MSKHKEIVFETEIIQHLINHDWVEGQSEGYDKALALYPEDVVNFIKNTQPEAYEKFAKRYATDTDLHLVKEVAKNLDKQGALFYLRNEMKFIGGKFRLCQFQPDLPTPGLVEKYQQNILRVVRQVYYSEHNKNSIDLVLFVNGLPVATLELKTDFTQNVQDAINQYKYARLPKDPKTRQEEPLLAFKKRALVHFAVSTDEVYMTTHLKGKDTFFLPFNKGHNGGAGNPPNTHGYTTAYLWEEIFAKDVWLRILGRFLHLQQEYKEDHTGKKHLKESLIFPRYHQFDAVRQLIADSKENGSGHNYLIQHSAGSGKSNSIAWLAHQLSSLHNAKQHQVFDTVIVLTDRTVLDFQLQETITQFEHKSGVVVTINREEGEGSKSAKLADALEHSASIIVVTIQTFPFVLEAIQERTSLKDKTFAIIADEAHSSQSGSTAKKLKEVLSAQQMEEGEEISAEDVLNATLEANANRKNISFFAFTATPKAKTMEMFGRPKHPELPLSDDNKPEPFHIYTMQQAIEEGFILDVLKNYTTYDVAYKLASHDDDKEVDSKKAKVQLAKWVKLHPYNIAQKIEIIIEHFRTNIAPLLGGKAKAMVVTSSRKEAVRYKIAFDQYIQDQGYPNLQAMVAYSGSVIDDVEGEPKEYTELNQNPGLKGRDMRKAFDTDEYQVMLVANKFQTGFDQPKLCAMYVDKKLSGVDAVQTLSRLNRTYPGKDKTFILDFFNEPEEIKEAFDPYYTSANLDAVTDPNLIFDLQIKLDSSSIYTQQEVEQFADAFFDPKGTQASMASAVKPAADRFNHRYKVAVQAINSAREALDMAKANQDEALIHNAEMDLKGAKEDKDELDIFKKDLGTFVRMYEFLSQIVDYADADLEKLNAYAKGLLPNLVTGEYEPPIDLSEVEMTHYNIKNKKVYAIDLTGSEIRGIKEPGSAYGKDRKTDTIAHIVEAMNELFAGELTEADKLNYAQAIRDKVMENDGVMAQFKVNTPDQVMLGDFPSLITDAVIDSMDVHQNMASQVLSNEQIQQGFAKLVMGMVYSQLEQVGLNK
ncbi:MAG: type I restriction endonuclease [Thiomicrorhabdus chilensis]|uniref:type I restriction endonuclease subunit R n=1 Tax=Thiomicrorhabdus chilensis TaxID=63656 RepID=UPI00299DA583|nr:type I restriction endonuclease [Thiomicrorhabdus chilensis]MDX1346981.1 type I restriction endonuclease [Thiomicrorhabdus chilensis]